MARKPSSKTSNAPQRQPSKKPDLARQQLLLDIFRDSFGPLLASDAFPALLRDVKQALYDRDFAGAFSSEPRLSAYAARWSPTRALCYDAVLSSVRRHLSPLAAAPAPLRVLALGAAAAETVALAGLLHADPALRAGLRLLDSAPWGSVVSRLAAAATALAAPPGRLGGVAFAQRDVLALGRDGLAEQAGEGPVLVTLLFTLNELFTVGGVGRTTAFLLDLTAALAVGSLLLVVDSPGSYSEATVGRQARRYPMKWLLDRVLLGTEAEPVRGRRWAKLESRDSEWFRLQPGALEYPIPLEDMRYQLHLYRVEDAGPVEDGEED